jgi:hypothetical protein
MKIVIENGPSSGVPLQKVPFGAVVRLPSAPIKDPCYYIVVSEMNGSGDRVLVSLRSGTLKRNHDNGRVVVVSATLYVHGDGDEEL